MKPLVSVIIPANNAGSVLSFALSSVLAQTYPDWEIVLVDDGSRDRTWEVGNAVTDGRVRRFRLESNHGRGFARQYALERAAGEYVCMLDADDWMYPWRIEEQIQVLESCPSLSYVTAGMAIAGRAGSLTGVRGVPLEFARYSPAGRLRRPRTPFAPSMFRTAVARAYGFDPSLTVAEDADFLMRLQREEPFGVLPRILYVYSEHGSVSLEKLLLSAAAQRRIYAKHWRREPLAAAAGIVGSTVKSAVYCGIFAFGAAERLVRRRSRRPTAQETAEYRAAYRRVAQLAAKHFSLHIGERDIGQAAVVAPAGA